MKKHEGFTLVELSIVLVIIGLIVGGIVGGQALIHSAKMSRVVSDMASYKQAVRTFELQYDQIPGDFSEGSLYWPASCNGNNDRLLYRNADGAQVVCLWRHLREAGMLPGNYRSS